MPNPGLYQSPQLHFSLWLHEFSPLQAKLVSQVSFTSERNAILQKSSQQKLAGL